MENASKALLIAGAILLVVAIIAIAVGIVSSTRGAIDTAENQGDTMSAQMHNKQLLNYESSGKKYDKSFDEMRECVRTIMSMNESNKNNRQNIVLITPYLVSIDSNGNNTNNNKAYWYVDDKLSNGDETNAKWPISGSQGYSGANNYTIEELYNVQPNKNSVINSNNENKNSMYNITLEYDKRGYITHVIIKKRSTVSITYWHS